MKNVWAHFHEELKTYFLLDLGIILSTITI